MDNKNGVAIEGQGYPCWLRNGIISLLLLLNFQLYIHFLTIFRRVWIGNLPAKYVTPLAKDKNKKKKNKK